MSEKSEILFEEFAAALEPTERWIEDAEGVLKLILGQLRGTSRFRVSRCELVGGLSKRTSTRLKADVDAVVYYEDDDQDLSRHEVVMEMLDILRSSTDLEVPDFRSTSFLLHFTYDGIPLDLVPVRDNKESGYQPLEQHRFPRSTSMMQQWTNDVGEVTASSDPMEASKDLTLSWPSREWMKKQPSVVPKLARLAKFWSQTVLFDQVVNGKAYIFELLAVKSYWDMESTIEFSFVRCFRQFLFRVKGLDHLRVAFGDKEKCLYKETDILREIRYQRPLLMDPVNPFSNLLDIKNENVKKNFFEKFSVAANLTLQRLTRLGGARDYVPISILSDIFEPPFKLNNSSLNLENIFVRPIPWRTKYPRMRIEKLKGSRFDRQKKKLMLESLMLNVSSVVFTNVWKNLQEVNDDNDDGQSSWLERIRSGSSSGSSGDSHNDASDAILEKAVESAADFLGGTASEGVSSLSKSKGSFLIPVGRNRSIRIDFNHASQRPKRLAGHSSRYSRANKRRRRQ